MPWELGLAETQQALLDSELRNRVVLQTDGQMRTGRDIVVASLLGADEMGLSTAPLIATGCIMMRVCHLNTCPVGVATQDPELRARFKGTPEHVVTLHALVAEETRKLMAALGIRRFERPAGRTCSTQNDTNWKTRTLDLRPLLAVPPIAEGGRRASSPESRRSGGSANSFDLRLLVATRLTRPRTEFANPLVATTVTNGDLAVGGTLSNRIVSDRGPDGLPDGAIEINLRGSAGQTAGAWLAGGVEMSVEGDVNDYAGKGLSGGCSRSIRPERATSRRRRT